jgi:hypothetical protein
MLLKDGLDEPLMNIQVTSCSECEEEDAVVHCNACGVDYCDICDQRRHKKKANKTHERTPIVDGGIPDAAAAATVPGTGTASGDYDARTTRENSSFDIQIVPEHAATVKGVKLEAFNSWLDMCGHSYNARCAFFGRNLHPRMPLDPTHVRLKRTRV